MRVHDVVQPWSPYGEWDQVDPTCHMTSWTRLTQLAIYMTNWTTLIQLAIWRVGQSQPNSPYGEWDEAYLTRHMASGKMLIQLAIRRVGRSQPNSPYGKWDEPYPSRHIEANPTRHMASGTMPTRFHMVSGMMLIQLAIWRVGRSQPNSHMASGTMLIQLGGLDGREVMVGPFSFLSFIKRLDYIIREPIV